MQDYADALTILNERLRDGEITFNEYMDVALSLAYDSMTLLWNRDFAMNGQGDVPQK